MLLDNYTQIYLKKAKQTTIAYKLRSLRNFQVLSCFFNYYSSNKLLKSVKKE